MNGTYLEVFDVLLLARAVKYVRLIPPGLRFENINKTSPVERDKEGNKE